MIPIPPNLAQRRLVGELMDDPALDPHLHRQALAGLRRINFATRGAAALWREIEPILPVGRRLTLLDLATGSGDILAAIARRAGKRLECHGIDISPLALAEARKNLPPSVALHCADVLNGRDWPGPESPDIIISSLFLHHLTNAQALRLLIAARARAGRLVLISDLERSALAWMGVWAGTRLLTRSPIVHTDGTLSIEAAYRPSELLALATRAGMKGASVRRQHPFRLLLRWKAPSL